MQDTLDKFAIMEVVQAWAVARDSGDWERLRATVHPEATMTATWYHGNFDGFIRNAQESWAKGARSMHVLGGTMVTLAGGRAIAQTRMTIMSRGKADGVDVDVACTGRFYDFFERRQGIWRIAERRCIYEKDRMDPVVPGAKLTLDPARLGRFPTGYQHLAYMQSQRGTEVNPALPTAQGEILDALVARGEKWLAG